MSDGIQREVHNGKEILIIDFSSRKEAEMISMMIEFRSIIIADAKPQLTLGIFNDRSFITPKFMVAFRKEKRAEVTPFIKRQAVVGLNETKKIILKGYNLFFNRDIRAFDTKEAALQYLVSEK